MKFDSIQIHSAPEALVQQIVAQIENGALARGVCLPSQRKLAKMFDVGLGTVREAIRILNVMGYVDVIQGKGTFVSDFSENAQQKWARFDKAIEAVSLADLMKAREIVECEVAFLAAGEADEDSIRRLKRITADMEASFEDTQTYYALDFDFHIAVAEASENQALIEIVRLLVDKSHTHVDFMDNSLGISQPTNMRRCIDSAIDVVDCIASGAAQPAAEAMRAHLGMVNERLMKGFAGKWKTI